MPTPFATNMVPPMARLRAFRVTTGIIMTITGSRSLAIIIIMPCARRLIMPHIRQIILGPQILHFLSCRIEDEVDFRNLKASDFDLEPHGDEALQLDLADFL